MPPTYHKTPRRVATSRTRYRKRRYVPRTNRRYARRPRYRRTRYTRRRRPAASLTSLLAARRMMVMRNPFSLATTNPKIPDNRCTFSAGQRLQVAGEVTSGTSKNNSVIDIILYPGLNSGLSIQRYIDTGPDTFNGPVAQRLVGLYNNHAKLHPSGILNNGTQWTTLSENDVEKWRLVSQGLHLSLVTNTEENDGWFEYIRVPVDLSLNRWNVASTLTNANEVSEESRSALIPNKTSFEEYTKSMIDHVTYQSGKLRDIHKYAFTLHRSGEDHEFSPVRNSYPFPVNEVEPGEYAHTGNKENMRVYTTNNEDFHRLIDDTVDSSYGAIIIRIHGNYVEDGVQSGTKLLYHMVSNQEIIYAQTSNLSRFHTHSTQV